VLITSRVSERVSGTRHPFQYLGKVPSCIHNISYVTLSTFTTCSTRAAIAWCFHMEGPHQTQRQNGHWDRTVGPARLAGAVSAGGRARAAVRDVCAQRASCVGSRSACGRLLLAARRRNHTGEWSCARRAGAARATQWAASETCCVCSVRWRPVARAPVHALTCSPAGTRRADRTARGRARRPTR